ncbi:hypothetical protein [Motiliproteus sp. SC1-56]|uniref:hypothetical protein n=1 Tax=Motiliproteus sp. SC1-56 TaxID=2799565 RepID=UPI001A8E0D10|nr:hypothetical protein [Motiliproteus sp. SC1-56]
MRGFTLCVLAATVLAGCASNMLEKYAGKDIREVMVDYGEPVSAFDLPDGRRAFQWVQNNSYQTPTRIISHRQPVDRKSDPGSWVSNQTTIFGGEIVESSCLYTLIGRWDESIDGWRVLEEDGGRMTCHR